MYNIAPELTHKNLFRNKTAALRGARFLAVFKYTVSSLRSVRLAFMSLITVFFYLSRYSADLACAVKPSPCAKVDAILPNFCAPSGDTIIKLERFWKSYTPKGDENRAVREVGST